jgi:hypothetical protein
MEIVIELRLDGSHYEELYRIPVRDREDAGEFRHEVWNLVANRFPETYGSWLGPGLVGLAIDPLVVGSDCVKAMAATEGLVEFLSEEYAR